VERALRVYGGLLCGDFGVASSIFDKPQDHQKIEKSNAQVVTTTKNILDNARSSESVPIDNGSSVST